MNIFIAFANQDRDVRDKLLRQMNLVKDRQGWNIWSSKEIKAGERWDEEIKQRLMDSEVIVLLLSTDFFNSKYIVETELPKVVEKHRLGNCQIIPVIARVCHWKDTAFGEYAQLGDIQTLPTSERPIMSKAHWGHEDDPYYEVVKGIKESIQAFQKRPERERLLIEKQNQESEGARRRIEELKIAADLERLDLEKQKKDAELIQKREIEDRLDREAGELIIWERTLRLDYLEAYEDYLRKCPEGTHIQEAKKQIKRHKKNRFIVNYVFKSVGLLVLAWLLWLFLEGVKGNTKKSDFEMATVQGGVFTMGSHKSEPDREIDECQHQITVNTFCIGKYEVKQAEWQAIMGYNPSKVKNCELCPVDSVSWEEAHEFLKKLNAKYPGKNYRLPTEVEWEYAAKGGQKGHGYQYAGAENFNIVAWHLGNSEDQTHIVGQKAPNELGLYDMNGNVWELCQDVYNAYPNCNNIGVEGGYPIIRGGSWGDAAPLCRNANRSSCEKSNRNYYVGFRLASDY